MRTIWGPDNISNCTRTLVFIYGISHGTLLMYQQIIGIPTYIKMHFEDKAEKRESTVFWKQLAIRSDNDCDTISLSPVSTIES